MNAPEDVETAKDFFGWLAWAAFQLHRTGVTPSRDSWDALPVDERAAWSHVAETVMSFQKAVLRGEGWVRDAFAKGKL